MGACVGIGVLNAGGLDVAGTCVGTIVVEGIGATVAGVGVSGSGTSVEGACTGIHEPCARGSDVNGSGVGG